MGNRCTTSIAWLSLDFEIRFVSLFYIVALALLAFHLSHGIGSLFQTLGVTDKKLRPIYETGARTLAWMLFAGYVSIPDFHPFVQPWKGNCTMTLDAHIPPGPLEKKWTTYRNNAKIISPANKRKYKLIIVGSGLAGAAAAATLGEQGFNIECFCYQDSPVARTRSPRRAG